MSVALWSQCLARLEDELSPQQYNTWIRPLQAELTDNNTLRLLSPNRFVQDWVTERFRGRIEEMLTQMSDAEPPRLLFAVGSISSAVTTPAQNTPTKTQAESVQHNVKKSVVQSRTNPLFTFENFVEGKSNQLARAASIQVAENPGTAYNPLFIYGGVGLGKTHLMHAVGNLIMERQPGAKVIYLHSERFVADMVKALQHNAINEFKRYYRSVDALLIDDIQFFAGKERSQEEFFHTFNALLEG